MRRDRLDELQRSEEQPHRAEEECRREPQYNRLLLSQNERMQLSPQQRRNLIINPVLAQMSNPYARNHTLPLETGFDLFNQLRHVDSREVAMQLSRNPKTLRIKSWLSPTGGRRQGDVPLPPRGRGGSPTRTC